MRFLIGLALLAAVSPAIAQTPPAPSGSAKAAYSADTSIADLVADPASKAVLDRHVQGLTAHPAYEQIKSMSLRQVQPMSGGQITTEAVAKVDADLKALPRK
jgi:hypothetical protein